MNSRNMQDAIGLLRGLQIIGRALVKENEVLVKHLWEHSTVQEILVKNFKANRQEVEKILANPEETLKNLGQLLNECKERTCTVAQGARALAGIQISKASRMADQSAAPTAPGSAVRQITTDAANLDISSITLRELEHILSKRNKDREVSLRLDSKPETITEKQETKSSPQEMSKAADPPPSGSQSTTPEVDTKNTTPDSVFELSSVAKQRKVPASRIARMASFGGLFAGLGIGTVSELAKGALGLGGSTNVREAILSPSNAERIADTLCKVRGAALKIGQILSIQDTNLVSPQLVKAFERVRQAADYMPDWQVERVMIAELGADWRSKLIDFQEKPFAAASIGQVHRGTLLDGMTVAIKIQYPGVAQSIESDIDNLVGMLKIWDVFPKGFFIDNLVKVAKRELAWEVDYIREADYTEKFKEMINQYPEYYVPTVIKDITTKSVLTTELVPGVPLDKCFEMSYDHRKIIAESTLKLCLRELFELQCMQTDPNWSNFLYDAESRRLMLIDFGSTRFYPKEFITKYRQIIVCAANDDRKGVLEMSREMGFLTGYETRQMNEAHVDAVMILGEIFRHPGEFDFGAQNTTRRIASLVPTMVAHRLCPPPEEIYSIHRKLSGVFLLCSRLSVRMDCRSFYRDIVEKTS